MSLPFTVDNFIVELKHDFNKVTKYIVDYKYKFSIDFEAELSLEVSEYAHNVFDYLYNLFHCRSRGMSELIFRKNLEDFKDMDFRNAAKTCNYIESKCMELVLSHRTYFFDFFGFKHEDPLYITRKMMDNKSAIRQKILEY